jgi:peptidoglycan-associated lipoprotein
MLNKKIFLLASSVLALASCGGGKKVTSQVINEPATEQTFANSVKDRVFFAFDSSELSTENKATLDKQAEWIKSHGHAHYTVEGHADERGTREYNIALGERRAHSAKKYLLSKGVESNHLNTVSFGKEKPAVHGHDEQAWAQNRRAVTLIGEAHHEGHKGHHHHKKDHHDHEKHSAHENKAQ